MIVDVEAEINKHKNCRERGKLERAILEYKNLARHYAADFNLAGKYNRVALKLQEICDTLPPENIKVPGSSKPSVPVKTASISSEENAKIHAAWRKKAGGVKR